jgi:hypothetical protein
VEPEEGDFCRVHGELPVQANLESVKTDSGEIGSGGGGSNAGCVILRFICASLFATTTCAVSQQHRHFWHRIHRFLVFVPCSARSVAAAMQPTRPPPPGQCYDAHAP